MTLFATIAVLLTIATVGLVVWPLLRAGANGHPVAATVTALAIPAAVLVVYLVVSNHDWRPTADGSAVPAGATGTVEEAVASLERKLAESPGDEEGWILLGSSYLSLNRPDDAANAYRKALEVSGGRNVDARLGIAEARIVQDPQSLTGPIGAEIEAVLALEPANPKALWYGGLLSLARGEPAVARERWRALLDLSPPERVRQIIEAQLAELDGNGAAAGGVAASEASAPGPDAPSIGITVSLSDAVRSQVSSSAPLFIFVRDAGAAGPPLAVVRRQANELPLTLQISDADIMLPGRSLAGVSAATLVARVANGGDPIAKAGDVYGEAKWQRAQGEAGPVQIIIDQVVGP